MTETKDRFLSRNEAAEFLHTSVRFMDGLRADGEVPYFKPSPKKILFKLSDLQSFMDRCRVPAANESELSEETDND